MPYGFRMINGRNVTVVDENTPSAVVRDRTDVIAQEAPNNPQYSFNPSLLRFGIPAIRVDSNFRSVYTMPRSDTGGRVYGTTTVFYIEGMNNLPDTYPLKWITGVNAFSRTSGGFGIQVLDANGRITFDSSYPLVTPLHSIDGPLGREFTFPPVFYYMPTSVYMHWTGNWQLGGGIRRVGNTNRWQLDIRASGTAKPSAGTRVGHFFVFDDL